MGSKQPLAEANESVPAANAQLIIASDDVSVGANFTQIKQKFTESRRQEDISFYSKGGANAAF